MINKHVIFFVSIIIVLCSCHKKKIPPFTLTKIDSLDYEYILQGVKDGRGREFVYVYEGNIPDENISNTIDTIVCNNVTDDIHNYYSIWVYILNKSKHSNQEHLNSNPRDFLRKSMDNDLLFSYQWTKSKFLSKKRHESRLEYNAIETVMLSCYN